MRITQKDLDIRVNRINEITESPMECSTLVDGKHMINVGHYHIDGAYGGVKLVRTANNGGAIEDISRGGFGTKRELYNFLNAFIAGIYVGKGE